MCITAQNSAFIFNGQNSTPNPLQKYVSISILAQDFLELKYQVQKQDNEIKTLKSQLASLNNVTAYTVNMLMSKYIEINAEVTDLRNEWDTANSTLLNKVQNLYSEMLNMSNLLQFINNSNHVGIIHNSLIRLADGDSLNSGRVEIFFLGEWGTVCDDGFNDNAAKVACRMLGKPTANALAYGRAYFGEGTGRIVYDDLGCSGDEVDFEHCHNRGIGNSDCNHYEDAGVRCG